MYDLTEIACLGAYLRFLEVKINEHMSENIALWEKKFGEGIRLINPRNKQERLLKYIYFLLGPILIAGAWTALITSILGITLLSIVYSLTFCSAIIFLTIAIGRRKLKYAENFVKDFRILNKNN